MDLSGESNKIAKEPVEEIKILWPHHNNIIPKLSGQSYHISNHISDRQVRPVSLSQFSFQYLCPQGNKENQALQSHVQCSERDEYWSKAFSPLFQDSENDNCSKMSQEGRWLLN